MTRSSWFPWAAGALLLIAAVVIYRRQSEQVRPVQVSVRPPEKTAWLGAASIPVISPDGQRLAFAASVEGKTGLWIAEMESSKMRVLPETENAALPFWSPDSRSLGFFSGGQLRTIEITADAPVDLCDAAQARGGTWNRDGVIVFAARATGGLYRIPAAGGNPEPVTVIDRARGENNHRAPWFLPDGRHFLYTARSADREKSRIYVADLASADPSKDRRELVAADSNAAYALPGYLLFIRNRALMAQPFDAGKLAAGGDALPLTEQIDYISLASQGQFSVSQTGVLAYTFGATAGDVQLTWFDRYGQSMGTVGEPGVLNWPAISPDGNKVADYQQDPRNETFSIWVFDLANGKGAPITDNSRISAYPVWAPDSNQLSYSSGRDGMGGVYRKKAGAADAEEVVEEESVLTRMNRRPDDWSRDGRYILEERGPDPKTGFDIWLLPQFGDRKPTPYLQTRFAERRARFSPDGRWVAYDSNESGRMEVYVVPFPGPGAKSRVSQDGGSRPLWSRDGKQLFYISLENILIAADIQGGERFTVSERTPLFASRMRGEDATFDVAKDGRFLMPVPAQITAAPVNVLVNWSAALKK